METMASRCYGGKMPKCPIVDALFDARAPVGPAKPALFAPDFAQLLRQRFD
jgi:hypothetical protein